MANTSKKQGNGAALTIAGLAAAGAAAAGYYFYASPKAKQHRKIASKWATDMKKEVVAQTKSLEKATPRAVNTVVDRVAKAYAIMRSVDASELKRAAQELKSNWEMIQSEARKGSRKAVKTARKTVRKVKKAAS